VLNPANEVGYQSVRKSSVHINKDLGIGHYAGGWIRTTDVSLCLIYSQVLSTTWLPRQGRGGRIRTYIHSGLSRIGIPVPVTPPYERGDSNSHLIGPQPIASARLGYVRLVRVERLELSEHGA
jgi:hypothetical protein